MKSRSKKERVVLDRCNIDVNDRAAFRGVAFQENACAVYFDVDAAECERRVNSRRNHPTLARGRGYHAIRSFAKKLQIPTVEEGLDKV